MDSLKTCGDYYKLLNYQSVASQNGLSIDQGAFLQSLLGSFSSSPKNVSPQFLEQIMGNIFDVIRYGSPDEDTLNLDYSKEMGEILNSPLGIQYRTQSMQMSNPEEEVVRTR